MVAQTAKRPIRKLSVAQAVQESIDIINKFELDYNQLSANMLTSVQTGETPETRDISTWMTEYQGLKMLAAKFGLTIGSRTKITKRFTTVA